MLRTKFACLWGFALIIAAMFCFSSPVFAHPIYPILGFEWSFNAGNQSSQVGSSEANFSGYELSKTLNENRDEIGRNLFSIIHPNANYDYTEPILMAEKPGNQVMFEIPIHWHRDLVAFQHNHLTRIRWQIGSHQHLKAEVTYDNSTFPPTHLNEMNDSLRLLLNHF
ncbi:hypothetical protein [Lyngbya sp. PCC 8106]|uniref:hypothetical protein n=1 Tax=Lyngbya sp. (strain PCC 8106) TaxID=313612 RepID=UPI0000EA96DD|nr:hypothetical protein [Lyngbya sp. PCC 8106]EAW35687.1 hypothetical protein L8106_08461 [Lyngbya sp. PCC 8106]